MRNLVIAMCLIGTIWAYHNKHHDFKVVIDKVELSNIPIDKYKIDVEDLKPYLQKIAKEAVPALSKKQPAAGIQAIMNDYADKIFTNLDNLMVDYGLDPLEMPDEKTGFSYTLIINYNGELELTHGWLQDISTMRRNGDVVVSYSSNTKYLQITIPIIFDVLQFTYDYSAKIMGLGPTGGIAGKIKNIKIDVMMGFDTHTLVASLDNFVIVSTDHIDVNFNGNPLVDWLVNVLTDVITALLKPVILLIVENIVRGGLNSVVDTINSVVDEILNSGSTAAPTSTISSLIFNN